jgi:hypothetical protein
MVSEEERRECGGRREASRESRERKRSDERS